jgi:hypothetical protein
VAAALVFYLPLHMGWRRCSRHSACALRRAVDVTQALCMPRARHVRHYHGGITVKYHTKFSYLRQGLPPLLLAVVAVWGVLFGPQPASAQGTCIQDVWRAHGNTQNLTCSANDVTLAQATNIQIQTGGSCDPVTGVCSCFAGQTVTFTADFRMDLIANERFDVGFYLATDNDPNNDGAITGQCTATASLLSNTRPGNFINLDAAPDVCGDITGPLNSTGPAATDNNPLFVSAQISAQCPLTPGQQLRMPFATTWRQPGSNQVCSGTGNGTTTNDVFPGSPSKCNKGILTLPITSISTTLNVTKTALTPSVPERGGSATYSVEVQNTSTIDVTLRSLTDNPYGDITTVHGDPNLPLSVTATTCVPDADPAKCEVGGVIAPGATCSCTFTGNVPPGDFGGPNFPDTVTACADNSTNPNDVCDTDDAEVSYTDESSAPTLTKTASNAQCVIDVTYDVVVNNTNARETLTLITLSDDVYGDITQVQGNVRSTTCGQAPGPGTLPFVIAAAGNYSCSFVGRINSCDTTVHDTVTGDATDEDAVPFTPSDDATVVVDVTRP